MQPIEPPRPHPLRRLLARWYHSLSRRLLALPVRLLQRWLDFRFVYFGTERLGHLTVEPDLFLKEGLLGLRPAFREIVLVRPGRVANAHMLRYWARHLRTLRSPLLNRLLWPLTRDPRLVYSVRPYAGVRQGTARYGRILSAWGDRPPLLSLWPEDAERGRRALDALGVPRDAWFVCVHAREEGWAPADQQRFRNCDIETMFSAMDAITRRGGWCIRMGDSSMKPLPRLPRVVDYALHELKSDWLDIFLCASARFFIGGASGIVHVSQVFGVPVAHVNQAPLDTILNIGSSTTIGIPKLLWSDALGRLLTFRETFDSPAAGFRYDHELAAMGLRLVDNSAEEILELVGELLALTDRTLEYSPADERLQLRFKSLMREGHYGFAAPSRVGRDFLRRHEALLVDALLVDGLEDA